MVLHSSNRRAFLRTLAGGTAGIALCRHASAENTPLQVNKLSDTFLLITGAPGNVLAVIGAEASCW